VSLPEFVRLIEHPGGMVRTAYLEALEARDTEATHVAIGLYDGLRLVIRQERERRQGLQQLVDAGTADLRAATARIAELGHRLRAMETQASYQRTAREGLQERLAEVEGRNQQARALVTQVKRDLEAAQAKRAALAEEREQLVAHVEKLLQEKRQTRSELRALESAKRRSAQPVKPGRPLRPRATGGEDTR
jgi:chromosome segregation ATPase